MTESGKTTLAKRLCWKYTAKGIATLVLDPLNDPGWHATLQTDDAEYFLATVRASRQCAVFIDESGEMIGRYNEPMFWLSTRGRHYGHNCHFLTQRYVQLNKTVRDQCSMLFLFNSSMVDAKSLAIEWNREELRNANSLRQFECFNCQRFGDLKKITITC